MAGLSNTRLRGSLVFVLCLLSVAKSSAYIVTSSNSVIKFSEMDLSPNLQKFIEHEEVRLKVIKGFKDKEEEASLVEQRLKEFKLIEQQLKDNETAAVGLLESVQAHHPTSVFALIRNFISNWEEKFDNQTLYGKRFREFIDTEDVRPLPNRYDLHRVAMAITVIQEVYNVTMKDMTRGLVKGHQGEALSRADCYDIGQTMRTDGLLDSAIEWLEFAISDIDLENVQKETFTFNVSNALATLAKLAFQQNKDQGTALKLFEKAAELDPDNEELYQDYVKHRSGRNVTPMPELKRLHVEPWRKKFFDMCTNSTNVTLYDIQNKTNPRLRCRYKSSAVVPYSVYKEEILSVSPYISLIYNFATDNEAKEVKNATLNKTREYVLPGNDRSTLWQFRGSVFRDFENSAIANISWKSGDVTGMNVQQQDKKITFSLGEPVQVIDYGIGGLALPHAEFRKSYSPQYMGIANSSRQATLIVQLSDVDIGGATVFIEQNITIAPRKGMAVLLYSSSAAGDIESSLYVGTCPLAVGRNIVLEKGIWQTALDVTRVCGRKVTSTRLAQERVLALSKALAGAKELPVETEGKAGGKERRAEGEASKSEEHEVEEKEKEDEVSENEGSSKEEEEEEKVVDEKEEALSEDEEAEREEDKEDKEEEDADEKEASSEEEGKVKEGEKEEGEVEEGKEEGSASEKGEASNEEFVKLDDSVKESLEGLLGKTAAKVGLVPEGGESAEGKESQSEENAKEDLPAKEDASEGGQNAEEQGEEEEEEGASEAEGEEIQGEESSKEGEKEEEATRGKSVENKGGEEEQAQDKEGEGEEVDEEEEEGAEEGEEGEEEKGGDKEEDEEAQAEGDEVGGKEEEGTEE